MGYRQKARSITCGHCERRVAWFVDISKTLSDTWRCECGARNHVKPMPEWPNVPRSLYIGPDTHARFKVYPVPPNESTAEWALPYSIRSFVYQASAKFGECFYRPRQRGTVMGESVFSDNCYDSEHGADYDDHALPRECHLVTGWTTGQHSCGLWQRIEALCQTDSERRFLRSYLGFVKDREFPMLVPQAWLGIADRRRPDFVAFVPLQYWKYKWLAVQLDAAHSDDLAASDALRDDYVRGQNYEVLSLRPKESGYLEEVRRLVERIDEWMALSQTDAWQTAVEAEVQKVEPPPDTDMPF